MDPIQIVSERGGGQQQDVVNGNLIRGEQGVCNAARVPGSRLIAFGFVQIWLPLREERKLPDGSLLFYPLVLSLLHQLIFLVLVLVGLNRRTSGQRWFCVPVWSNER